jgi:hypothetical protein
VRLWSIHPKYLDRAGLVAVWREALLAQKVLQGATRGYRHHPQLIRFRQHPQPVAAIAAYLHAVWEEASRRGYQFDPRKIGADATTVNMPLTTGQLWYEFAWLCDKLRTRDRQRYQQLQAIRKIDSHPLFSVHEGEVEAWERIPGLSEK